MRIKHIDTVSQKIYFSYFGDDQTGRNNKSMSRMRVDPPVIVNLPQVGSSIEKQLQRLTARKDLEYVEQYPTVYIYHNDGNHEGDAESGQEEKMPTVYVGETTDIARRINEHGKNDPRERDDWAQIDRHIQEYQLFVIGHRLFNKSLTLDVENQLINYLMASTGRVNLINRRGNPQERYFPDQVFDALFHKIWKKLRQMDSEIFGSEEEICDSAIFKASPFHRLTTEQVAARDEIYNDTLQWLGINESGEPVSDHVGRSDGESGEDQAPLLILVQGAAGTGKTVLLSTLFTELCDVPGFSAGIPPQQTQHRQFSACVIVNQGEQENVYTGIAMRLGLQKGKKKDQKVVFKASQFLNRTSQATSKGHTDATKPTEKVDVVLIDEAHLLEMQSSRGYSGKNQLVDILKRARVVIAVFDPEQILRMSQRWDSEQRRILEPYITGEKEKQSQWINLPDPDSPQSGAQLPVHIKSITLNQQMRMCADQQTLKWLRDLASGRQISELAMDTYPANSSLGPRAQSDQPNEQPYEIRVCDSPRELLKLIRQKNENNESNAGLSRVLATYDWPYSSSSLNEGDPDKLWTVNLHRDKGGQWETGYAPEGYQKDDPHQFRLPWNRELAKLRHMRHPGERQLKDQRAWAEKKETINEAGSIYTIQGFDLNYAGVILGPSVKLEGNRIIIDQTKSENSQATQERSAWKKSKDRTVEQQSKDYVKENLFNEINVLLTRGVHGLYIFAVDQNLQKYLTRMTRKEMDDFDRWEKDNRQNEE